MATTKTLQIINSAGEVAQSRDIGAEAQYIDVSRDGNGNIIEDITAPGAAVASTESLTTTLKNIQSSLTFDDVPVTGSNNPVKSDGLVPDNALNLSSEKPLQNRIIAQSLNGKLNTYAQKPSDWDTIPTENSNKPVTSGGVFNAISSGGTGIVNVKDSPTSGNVGGVIENAVKQFDDYTPPLSNMTKIIPNKALGDFSHAEGISYIENNTTNREVVASEFGTHAEGLATSAIGMFAHSEGNHTKANGQQSHAEGQRTIAYGVSSHAEGVQTTAGGDYSHAEGVQTSAEGDYSHAEGWQTSANGNYSHAEGEETIAEGAWSHSEGYNTSAVGMAAHAEGGMWRGDTSNTPTVADGDCSHAEGGHTSALGEGCHAEGWQTCAVKERSHAEGWETSADGRYSHTEGWKAYTVNDAAHAEGYQTTANSIYCHAEGECTLSDGEGSHAEGGSTEAIGGFSHSEGFETSADGNQSHTEGNGTLASGEASHAEGYGTLANNAHSHAEGSHTSASGIDSHAEGHQTSASQYCSHAEGYQTSAGGGEYSHAEGYQTLASGENSHVEGRETIARGYSSHAEGHKTIAHGLCSHAEGSNTSAIGNSSHVEGMGTIAIDITSHAEGSATTSKGYAAHAEGNSTCASGYYSHAEGLQTTADCGCSHAEGQSTLAKGDCSHAAGYNTIANSGQTVVGYTNVEKGTIQTYEANSGYFIVGSGSGTTRANCFRATESNTYGKTYSPSGADYAEMFEWLDGNQNNEDRAGKFVTIDGDKIKLATSNDDYILGVISGNPSVMGNTYDDQWQGMFETDIFGRPIYTKQERELEDGTKVYDDALKVSEDYDNTQEYIGRSDRPEWDAVGLLGKLICLDDGTAEVNGYVTVNDNSIATKANGKTKYRVLKRLDETHIQIMIL